MILKVRDLRQIIEGMNDDDPVVIAVDAERSMRAPGKVRYFPIKSTSPARLDVSFVGHESDGVKSGVVPSLVINHHHPLK
jgi:hypothetical protein